MCLHHGAVCVLKLTVLDNRLSGMMPYHFVSFAEVDEMVPHSS